MACRNTTTTAVCGGTASDSSGTASRANPNPAADWKNPAARTTAPANRTDPRVRPHTLVVIGPTVRTATCLAASGGAPVVPGGPGRAPGPAQRDSRVCLNSLSSGCSPMSPRTRSIVARATSPSPLGAAHQPGEHGVVADDEGRHAEDVELLDAALVLLADRPWPARRRRPRPARRRRRHRPGPGRRGPRHRSRRSPPSSWRAAKIDRCTARKCSGNRSRTATPAASDSRSAWWAGSSHVSWPSVPMPWLRKYGTKVTSHPAPASRPSRMCSWPLRAKGHR